MVVRSSSVSLPHFSLTLPFTCFQLPLMVSQFITFLLGKVQHCNRCASPRWRVGLECCGIVPADLGPADQAGGQEAETKADKQRRDRVTAHQVRGLAAKV